MNNFEKIKAMNIDEMAEMFYQGMNCIAYGDVDCETCIINGKLDCLCWDNAKDIGDKEKTKQWLEQESEGK